ncbi:MAG: permease [Candidatus Macondimonas sp.]
MNAQALGVLALLLGVMILLAQRRGTGLHRQASSEAWQQLRLIALRLPLALMAASLLGELLPRETLANLLGPQSGWQGIVLASGLGALLPGGPMVSFPFVILLQQAGMAPAPMVALMTAWSVLALHRVLSFELPLMGARFVALRWIVSLPLPLLAGALTALLLRIPGLALI